MFVKAYILLKVSKPNCSVLDTRTTQWEDPRLSNPNIAGPVSLIRIYTTLERTAQTNINKFNNYDFFSRLPINRKRVNQVAAKPEKNLRTKLFWKNLLICPFQPQAHNIMPVFKPMAHSHLDQLLFVSIADKSQLAKVLH